MQCIYTWRGSDVTRDLRFPDEFTNSSIFRLSTNYRSRPPIVNLANQIASSIELRDRIKVMRPGRERAEGRPVHWLSLNSLEEQARAVTEIVQRFASEGVPYNKMAILLRSVVKSGKSFVDALTAAGVPVQCPVLDRGGSFMTEFILPVFEFLSRQRPTGAPWEWATRELWKEAGPWVRSSEQAFRDALARWDAVIAGEKNAAYNVRGRLYDFLNGSGVRMRAEDRSLMAAMGVVSQIIRSMEEIHRRRLKDHKRRGSRTVMADIYRAIQRNWQKFGESAPISIGGEGVFVNTVHQAKGLEWPVVILPMLMDGLFPVAERPSDSHFPPEIANRYATDIEDERRLFYVAATRAKERLFLLDGTRRFEAKRSIFLHELAELGAITVENLADIAPAVWRIEAADLRDSGVEPLRVGLSDILLYLECPYQYGLRRIVAVQPDVGVELNFGKGLHELIQRRIEAGRDWTPVELRAHVEEHVVLPFMSEQKEGEAKAVIEGYVQSLQRAGAARRSQPEVDIEVMLEHGIVHTVVDRVQIGDDGTLQVTDWKTQIDPRYVARYERQVQFYTQGLRQHGHQVSRAEIVDVTASSRAGKVVAWNVNIEEQTLASLLRDLNAAIREISQRNLPPRPSATTCGCCDVFKICGERYDAIRGHGG